MSQKITPFLWFDTNAEEAVKFYVSVFKDATIGEINRYDDAGAEASGMPKGSAMTIPFQLFGQDFTALNGGPIFKFTEAISFVVNCHDQAEIDEFWVKLSEGGDPASQQCGWLKDKFGLSWQIVPEKMGELVGGGDPAAASRAMKAMLEMKKIDIKALEQARDAA